MALGWWQWPLTDNARTFVTDGNIPPPFRSSPHPLVAPCLHPTTPEICSLKVLTQWETRERRKGMLHQLSPSIFPLSSPRLSCFGEGNSISTAFLWPLRPDAQDRLWTRARRSGEAQGNTSVVCGTPACKSNAARWCNQYQNLRDKKDFQKKTKR